MKRITLVLLGLITAFSVCCAQETDEWVSQPTRVVGRSFNADGEITKELVSEFSYLESGKLFRYDFPGYYLTAGFSYIGNYLAEESVLHNGFEHGFFERAAYTYENGRLKTKSHVEGDSYYQEWVYSYYDDGRLERIDYSEDYGDCFQYWHYDYEDNGHTVIESYYSKWWSLGWVLMEKTTSHYDNSFNLASELFEKYNQNGELLLNTKTDYSYTEDGLLEEFVTQQLDNGTWVNTAIQRHVRDDAGKLVERLDGSWDTESGEWHYSNRITFETSEDGETYTVSFYKKSGDSWVWDVFHRQTVLFGDFLKPQQRMLSYMYYEAAFGHGNINQLEFTLEQTKEPVYLDTEDNAEWCIRTCPNPVTDELKLVCPSDMKPSKVEFYDLEGRLILSQHTNLEQISTKSLTPGIYVMCVTMVDGSSYTDKVIKQ